MIKLFTKWWTSPYPCLWTNEPFVDAPFKPNHWVLFSFFLSFCFSFYYFLNYHITFALIIQAPFTLNYKSNAHQTLILQRCTFKEPSVTRVPGHRLRSEQNSSLCANYSLKSFQANTFISPHSARAAPQSSVKSFPTSKHDDERWNRLARGGKLACCRALSCTLWGTGKKWQNLLSIVASGIFFSLAHLQPHFVCQCLPWLKDAKC